MNVPLHCGAAYFGTAIDATGTLDVICKASKHWSREGRTHHLFDQSTGEFTTELEPYLDPENLGIQNQEVTEHGV